MVITFVNMVDPYKITCTQTPLGIISLYYILENNFETEICDLNYKYYKGEIKHHNKFRDNLIEIVKEIMKNQPQIVSIYSMCNTYHMSIIVGKLLKEMFPATKLILSGPHATLVAEDTLKDFQFVDYIGMGEGEKTILGNIKGILDNNFELFNGIAYRNYKSEIVTKWDRGNRINVNELKINDVCKINNPKDFNNILSIEGGRGCPFHCSFCSTQQFWGNIFQIKSIEKMLEEIEYYYNNYNINEFNIQHDLFTFDKNYILNFCDKLTKKVIPNINWGCSSRIDVITDVLLERMSNAGCSNIFYGIESGSDKIQKKINKNLKIDKVFDVVEKMMHLRMGATFSFIYGFPDETVEDKNATIKLIHEIKKKNYFDKSVNMDINLTCLNFLPGTQIGEQYYHQLEYNRLDGMTYYRNVKLDPIIDKLIRNHKRIFLHCYNLHKNTYIEQKYYLTNCTLLFITKLKN